MLNMFLKEKKIGLNLEFIKKNIECSRISLKLHVVTFIENYLHNDKLT